jgi:predicted HTH transcriptional regulator
MTDGVSDVKDGVNHARDGVKDGVNIVENNGINSVQTKILELVRDNPNITAKTISEEIGINHRNTGKNISKLKLLGLIERIGSDKVGHWVVKK